MQDRFGIGWRQEIAAGILANLESIDVVEVIADDFFRASRRDRRALRTLAQQRPVVLHGVTMGLASTVPVAARRCEAMGDLAYEIGAELWSEHLAFVRGGGREIGHLAAPPRNDATVAGTVENVCRARRMAGAAPLLENVATLIDPPGSTMDESRWIRAILVGADAELLLDLHNLHANATNFGFDAAAWLGAIPPERVRAVHLAGGRRIVTGRVLDDHLHDVPDAVYALLEIVAARVDRPLTVILERDGRYPAMDALLAQLAAARDAVARGRRRQEHAA